MRPAFIYATLLGSALMVQPVAAQTAASPLRGGFWWGGSLGVAHLNMDCGRCEDLPDSIPYAPGPGFQVGIGLGGTLSQRWLMGGSVSLTARTGENRDATLAHFALLTRLYPAAMGRLFVQGGMGVNGATLAGGGTLIESGGLSANLELGYGLWGNGRRAFGPYAGVTVGSNSRESASVSQDGPLLADPPESPIAVYLGLNATFH